MSSLRKTFALALDPELAPNRTISKTNALLAGLILFSVLVGVLETERTLNTPHVTFFWSVELLLLGCFVVEYALRAWTCIENTRFHSRWHYLRSPIALLDLAAIVIVALTFIGHYAFLIRLARLVKLLRVARLSRYSKAFILIQQALHKRRFELLMSFMLVLPLLLVTSTALYLIEGDLQPDTFGSIPRAMWWSIATLTTVGYGDFVPLTGMGRIVGAFAALCGVGIVAMPAGIIAGAMNEAIANQNAKQPEPNKIDLQNQNSQHT